MKRTWPIIGVKDVRASGQWYRALLGQADHPSEHEDFDLIVDGDDTVLLGLHEWGAHGEGPPLQALGVEPPGNGALLFIRVDDFEATMARARELVSHFETEPEVFLSGPDTPTFKVRDPDGYYLMINAL
jgi:hypothetical protein